jgi:hypothetical protein
LEVLSPLARRFITAIIRTSSSVKPQVVIFHMSASELIRSIASLSNAKAVPNLVAYVSAGKRPRLAEKSSSAKMLKESRLLGVLNDFDRLGVRS